MENVEKNRESRRCDVTNVSETLNDICNWNYSDSVAIEYHDLEKTIFINYAEVYNAKEMVCNFLECLTGFQFIGINFDIPVYCVPSLMLGILSSGHGFVNIPLESMVHDYLINSLRIEYLFTQHMKSEAKIVNEFTIHNEHVYLMKLKHIQKRNAQNTKRNCYAYGIATSGSTGMPKTVRVPHSSIVPNILDLKKILSVTNSDKIAQFTNFTFDPSIVEIFLAHSTGGALFMVSKSLKSDPERLLRQAYSSQISVLQVTPSVFLHRWSADRLKTTILSSNSSLRVLLLGGEAFPKANLFFELKHPQNSTKLFNIYGITEVSCWASINEIIEANVESDTRCLGTVLSQTVFKIRNEMGEIVTSGKGFLHIGSDTRVCSLDDEIIEDLQRPVFRDSGDIVEIDAEGRILYNGRKNRIIKRFGNKVDLTKIEKTALKLDFVKNCYALWDENHHKLHLCLTCTKQVSEYSVVKIAVMKHFHVSQPLHRPDKIHFLEHVEFNSSGKVCTQFLKQRCTEDEITQKGDPNQIEQIFRNIWKDSLEFGNDGFVKLGGTSIAALQMSNAISAALDIQFPELIGLLLRDTTFDGCLNYLKIAAANKQANKPIESTKSDYSFDNRVSEKVEDVFDDWCIAADQSNAYQWHKCRGQIYGTPTEIDKRVDVKSKTISNIRVLNTYDLQKCVDASPTVFRYSNGKSFATVGSHSGIICTFNLDDNNSVGGCKITLPDRIEASVLPLGDFKGIVGCYDHHVYCVNLKTGEIIWKYKTGDVVKCTAISCKQRKKIFVGSYDCHAYCLSAEDGSEIWKIKVSNGSITASGCLHLQSDSVLFGTLDGTCVALQQSSGRISWRHKLRDPIFVAPLALTEGLVLFCSVAGTLSCFDVKTDAEMWRYKIHGNVFSYILERNNSITKQGTIIVASQNKCVYFLESRDSNFKVEPALKHVLKFHSPIFATPCCEDNFLFVACTCGTLNVYSFTDNKLLDATAKLPSEVFSSPVVDDNLLIVGCRDNNVYILKLVERDGE